ncbi:gliding motility lipoprotein GldH [Aureispira anguillae]|uniref:Gliding motility lipoprotein GldH n=1 Tax=Aureispira anguillae TaxID=2864201 RepID=A0A915YJU7_9BACT|nr:gliding motility lipoprotein GldH [Aureispira anguillae]BDS14287.1 gliding motility lipoprotein GldH [Aureispira anguillae]
MPIITSHLKRNKLILGWLQYSLWSFVLVLCFSLVSCNTIYDETVTIENSQWSDDTAIPFEFEIQDTSKYYDLFLEVNHSIDYPYQNIYCWVETFELGTSIRKDQCSLELANAKGKWLGACNAETCDRKIPFIINTKFNNVGKYKIILTQNTRNAILKDINGLRLLITEAT